MQEWLITTIAQHPYSVYGIVILTSFVEGPILAMLGGVLIKLGYFPFLPIYFALMIGDLFGDVFWYHVGYYFGHPFIRRFGKYFSLTEEKVALVKKIFHKYKNRILIISKITMGFGFALVTLVTAGIVKISFKRYITINFFGQFFWTGFLILIGYIFGNLYQNVDNVLGKMSVAALFVMAFAVLVGYGKYVKTKITKTVQTT